MEIKFDETKLTKQIGYFRSFLLKSWKSIDKLMLNHDWDGDACFIDDWVDMNWGILVGRELFSGENFLSPYFVSVQKIKKLLHECPQFNYWVICKPKKSKSCAEKDVTDSDDPLIFSGFVSEIKKGVYGLYPPFDYVSAVDKLSNKIYRIYYEDVTFDLLKSK